MNKYRLTITFHGALRASMWELVSIDYPTITAARSAMLEHIAAFAINGFVAMTFEGINKVLLHNYHASGNGAEIWAEAQIEELKDES